MHGVKVLVAIEREGFECSIWKLQSNFIIAQIIANKLTATGYCHH
jgi:hypothetical protein